MTRTSDAPQSESLRLIDTHRMTPERAVDVLIDHAVELGASDIFFVSNEQHLAVQVRHLGMVRPISIVPVEQGRRMLAHIKTSSAMDLSEKRRPADGRWIHTRGEKEVDLRINIVPTLYGEDFAIRLLTRGSQLFELGNLGMEPQQLAQYQQMIASPGGLVLITGPTGSGKTATLYATLKRLNDGQRKINTIEDPVEYALDGIRQSQVNAAIDLGFGELLRGVLRQNPDVIMLGEIRDEETARTAVHAANSGILVFSTLHAPSAAGAVQSMRSLGVHSHFLATSLRGVVAQRLVRTLCPRCKTGFDISDAPETFDEVRKWLRDDEGKKLFAARGCPECHQSGYAARTGVFEVLPINKQMRDLISEGAPVRTIREESLKQELLPFRPAALLKVARGLTSTEEVFRMIPVDQMVDEE